MKLELCEMLLPNVEMVVRLTGVTKFGSTYAINQVLFPCFGLIVIC